MPANDAKPDMTIEPMPGRLRAAAASVGWTTLMHLQARTIPYRLSARDMMVQARTGSGKTGAFLLPCSRDHVGHIFYIVRGMDRDRVLLDEYYQQTLHAPLLQPEEVPSPKRRGRGETGRRRHRPRR